MLSQIRLNILKHVNSLGGQNITPLELASTEIINQTGLRSSLEFLHVSNNCRVPLNEDCNAFLLSTVKSLAEDVCQENRKNVVLQHKTHRYFVLGLQIIDLNRQLLVCNDVAK